MSPTLLLLRAAAPHPACAPHCLSRLGRRPISTPARLSRTAAAAPSPLLHPAGLAASALRRVPRRWASTANTNTNTPSTPSAADSPAADASTVDGGGGTPSPAAGEPGSDAANAAPPAAQASASPALGEAQRASAMLYSRENEAKGDFRQAIAVTKEARFKRDILFSDPEFRDTQLGRVPDEYSMMRGVNKDGNIERTVFLRNPKIIPGFLGIAAALFIGGTYYMGYLNEKRQYSRSSRQREEAVVHIGTPKLGGPFELTCTRTGKKVRSADLAGKWLYIYFGFTNCPDVCPDEMKKLSFVTERMREFVGDNFQPIFITVDAKRDDCEAVEEYLGDYNPDIMGFTGTAEEIDEVARLFRVFYAVPEIETFTVDDYLVDHSIVTYLMDPEGKFCEYTTKEYNTEEAFQKCRQGIREYEDRVFRERQQLYEQGQGEAPVRNRALMGH